MVSCGSRNQTLAGGDLGASVSVSARGRVTDFADMTTSVPTSTDSSPPRTAHDVIYAVFIRSSTDAAASDAGASLRPYHTAVATE